MTAIEAPPVVDAGDGTAKTPQSGMTLARRRLGPRGLSAAVYGSLLVLTLIVAQTRSNAGEPFVALTLFVAVAVFWLAEAWSELIAVRLAGPVTMRGGLRVMAGELPMMGAAVLPALALMTRSVGLTTAEQAIDVALAVGLAQLFVWGLAVGRALGRGWTVTLAVAAADVALGLVIVAMKVFVLH
jgi:hypothetical protein